MSFVFRRFGYYLMAFWVAATVNFFLPRLMPGDPVAMMFAHSSDRLTPDNIAALRKTFGFVDGPLPLQYLAYLKSVLTGDLGLSIKFYPAPVTTVLGHALVWTLLLVGFSTLLSFLIGSLIGAQAAWRRDGVFDLIATTWGVIANAVPAVVLAILILFGFGISLKLLPTGYAYDTALDPAWSFAFIGSVIAHAVMPVLALSIVLTGGFLINMRNNIINLIGDDYLVMAEAKGLSGRKILIGYGLRNALLPTITNLAITIGQVFAGSLVTEVVFNYPGVGNTLYVAILARDYPLIQGQLIVMTAAMLAANFIADLSYVLIDPRLRRA